MGGRTSEKKMAEPVLAAHNQLVYEAVIYALAEEPHKRRAKGDMIFADFGATQWCVQYLETAEIPDTLRVSVKVPALKGQAGVEEVLTEKYADIMVPAAEGFDASLEFNIDAPADSAAEELAMRVALLASVVSVSASYLADAVAQTSVAGIINCVLALCMPEHTHWGSSAVRLPAEYI